MSLATAMALLLPAAAASAQPGDRNCADFATQAEAQAYFDSKGGGPGNNVDGLDRNRDGIPCESLPAGDAPADAAPADAAPAEEPADQSVEQPAPEQEQTPAPGQAVEQPPGELPFTGPSTPTTLLGVGALLVAVGGGVTALFRYRGRHEAR